MSPVAEEKKARASGRRVQDNPVTAYAKAVQAGDIVAGRLVRLECERHLKNLDRQRTADFPYYFDAAAAQRLIDFFPDFLTLERGDRFVLPAWLQFSYGVIFGWKCWGGTKVEKQKAAFDKWRAAHPDASPQDLAKGEAEWRKGDLWEPIAGHSRHGYRKHQHGYLETSKGSGKALALDTPIPTPRGWKQMGELAVGDVVFDERGQPTTVVGAFAAMEGRECYEVIFDDNSRVVADAEHLWVTEQRSALRADGKIASAGIKMTARGKWKRAVRTTAEIARTVRYRNGKYRSANHSISLAWPLVTPGIQFALHPYALGAWLGDGDSDCGRLTVHDDDLELVSHLEQCGVRIGERQHQPRSPRTGRYRLVGWTHALRRLRLLNNKHIPKEYLRASIDQRLSLLQGLMDTDGYIDRRNGSCEFTSTKRELAEGALELICSLGIKATLREGVAKLYGRTVSPCWRIQFFPPPDMPVFRLTRKLAHHRVRHHRRRLSGDRRIIAVNRVPSVAVRCIAVDSPSSLFLAGRSMVPTHNSPSAGGIALYLAGFDGEAYAQIYSTGFDKGQAAIILKDAIRMVENSPDPEFRAEFIVGKHNILHIASGSTIQAMSSQHQSKSGPRPSAVLSDEIHEQRNGTVVSKAEAGFKNRNQPIGLKLTNSGSDRASYCWQLHQKSIDVLEGRVVDEQWFSYVCHLDPCQKHFNEGYRQPKDGCEDCDDWMDPAVWPKVAPALGVVIQPKYLQDAIDTALSVPSDYNLKRRLNFCIWTETHNVWISSDQWDACRVPAVLSSNPERRPCAAGLDLSAKYDLSSFVVAVRFDDPPGSESEEVEIEGMDEEGERIVQKLTLNFSIDLIPFFWIPEETLLERVRKERIPYDVWKRDGKIFVTKGAVIDYHEIYEFIVGNKHKSTAGAMKTFGIQKLGYDEKEAIMFATKLRDQGRLGDKVVAIPQGKKLSEVNKLIEMLVRSRRIRHDGHPVLAWNFANVEPHRDRLGALWIEKASEIKRIDGVTGSEMAIHQLMVLPKRAKSAGAYFV